MYSFIVIALILIFIVAIATFTLILNSFNALLSRKMQSISVLRTVGTTKSQLSYMVMLEGVILTMVGLIVGLALGYLITNFMLKYIHSAILSIIAQTESNPSYDISFWSPLWVFVAVIVLSLSTVYFVLKLKMKELFNNEAVNSLDEMNLKKRRTREVQNVINGDPSKGLARINTRMLKDFQGIKAALVITVVLLISINDLTGYLLDVADENVTVFDTEIWIQPYDDEVDMYQQTSDTEKILQPYDIQRVDSIYYSDYLNIAAINGKTMEEPSSIVFNGMDDALFDDFIKEHSLSKKDQLILLNKYDDEEFSQSMDVSDKDIFNISNRQTDGMESMDVEVDVVLKKIEEKYDYLYGGERIIITRLSNLKDNLYPLSKTQEVKIFISSDLSVENLKEINNKIDDLGYTGVYLYSEYCFSSFKQTVKTVVSVLTSFIFVYIGFVILVNVVNISISNYQKRKQDIAVLKSMGATSKQLDKMYLYETLYIVSVPWVLGIVLGHLLNIGVFILIRVLLPVSSLKYSINIKTFGLSFILVLVIIIVQLVALKLESKKSDIIADIRSY